MKNFFVFFLLVLSIHVQAQTNISIFSPVQASQVPAGEPPRVVQPPIENPYLFLGKRIAILASHGVEESEIVFPYTYLKERGASVDVLVPDWTPTGIITSRFLKPSLFVKASGTFTGNQMVHYDLIILTGGAWNAQVVRSDKSALTLVQRQHEEDRPIAAICAGSGVLIDAGLAKDLTMTGSPIIRIDLENAGARYVDQGLVHDQNIFTSRSPDDLELFVQGLHQALIGK